MHSSSSVTTAYSFSKSLHNVFSESCSSFAGKLNFHSYIALCERLDIPSLYAMKTCVQNATRVPIEERRDKTRSASAVRQTMG